MTTSPKSFRLTRKAQENLAELTERYELSEGRIINLLLTETFVKSGMDFGKLYAEVALNSYFLNKTIMDKKQA